MNRAEYYNYIEERLHTLSTRLLSRGKSNILDCHIHSEYFYRDLLNLLYSWNLQNLNDTQQNVEAIDLVDTINKIIVQVSATSTKSKLIGTFDKNSMATYVGYHFKFVSIARNADVLRQQTFDNIPMDITFDPKNDIYDIDSIINRIKGLEIEDLESVYKFIRKELGNIDSPLKLESDLTEIIKFLAKEELKENELSIHKSYEIEKKIDFNGLAKSRYLIDDYKVFQGVIDKIYTTFDKQGQNKSFAILSKMRKVYLGFKNEKTGDELYESITSAIRELIQSSTNFEYISIEQLDTYVDMLVVDAFIRCKIFENPNE